MSWIDDACKESDAIAIRTKLIEEQRSTVYGDLWEQLKKDIAELAARHRVTLHTNGSTFERVISPHAHVSIPGNIYEYDKSKDCHIKLGERKITVSCIAVNITFDIDLCPDNVVCLKRNGDKVELEQASMLILRPMAFPDLPKLP